MALKDLQQNIANQKNNTSSGNKAASNTTKKKTDPYKNSSSSYKKYSGQLTQERYNELRDKGYTKEEIENAYMKGNPQMTQELYNHLRDQGYSKKEIEKGHYDREFLIPWRTQKTAGSSFGNWGRDVDAFTSWSEKNSGDISKYDLESGTKWANQFSKNAQKARDYMIQLQQAGISPDTDEFNAYKQYYDYFSGMARNLSQNNKSFTDYRSNFMYNAGEGSYLNYADAKAQQRQLQNQEQGYSGRAYKPDINDYIAPGAYYDNETYEQNMKQYKQDLAAWETHNANAEKLSGLNSWIAQQDEQKAQSEWLNRNLGRGQDSEKVYQSYADRMAAADAKKSELESKRPDYYSYGISDELGNVYAYNDEAYNKDVNAWSTEYNNYMRNVYYPTQKQFNYASDVRDMTVIKNANVDSPQVRAVINRGKAISNGMTTADEEARNTAMDIANYGGSEMAQVFNLYRAGAKERRHINTDTWSEEKANTYYFLLGSGQEESAERFAKLTNDAIEAARIAQEVYKPIDEFQAAHPGWGGAAATAAGIALPLVAGVPEYLAAADEYLATGEINPNKVRPTGISERMVSNTAGQLNEWSGTINNNAPVIGGKGVGDLYQVALSAAQSYLSIAASGGMEAITLTQFFGSAASSKIYESLDKGMDPGKALALGTMSGIAEVAGEKLSIDNLIKIGDAKTARALLKDVLIQAGIEGSEEAFTNILNTLSDYIVNGDKNALQIAADSYASQGMSLEEANKQAMKDWLNEIGYDAVSGALSGAMGATGQSVRANVGRYKGNVGYLNDLASQTAEGSRSRQMAEDYGTRDRLSAYRGNQYAAQVQEDLVNQNTDTAVRAIEQRLTELGETGNVHQKAQDIANAVVGAMTDEEAGGWSMRPSDQISATATANMRQVVDELATAREQYVDYSKPDSSWTDPIMKGRFLDQRILSGNQAYNALYNAERKAENTLKEHTAQVTDLSEQILEAKKELGRLSPTDSAKRTELNNKIREAEKELKSHQDAILSDGHNVFTEEQKAASVDIDGIEYKVSGLTMADGQTQAKLTDADGNTMNVSIEDERLPAEFRNLALKVNTLGWAASMAFEHYKTGTDIRNYIYRVQAIQAFASEKISREAFMNSSAVKALNDSVLAEFLYSHGQELYNERQAKVKKATEKLNEKAQKAMEKTGDIDNVRTKGKGKVDTRSGWTMPDGTHYAGIQGKKLSAKQNAVVRMIDYISDALNLDYIIFDGDAKGIQGVYHDGGTIAININAGLAKLTPRVLAAETLSHELTHFEDEFAPEESDILREAVVTAAYNNNPDLFEQRVQAQMRMLGPNFQGDRHEQAIKELVAEACTTMLQNSKVVTEIARQNMTVAQKMADFIEQTINKIKQAIADAFADSDPSSYRKEVALIEKDMDRIQKLWDAALEKAVFNYNASKTIEEITQDVKEGKAIDPVSEVQFSRYYDEEYMDKAIALNDNTRFVSDENMQSAKRIRQMVQQKLNDPKLADKLKLPEDNVGNTFLSNSSYGGSEENTTICVRSLAAQALMDEIAKDIGAPLTVEDTLVISQEMMTWLNKPECIYCYVATDRRAYRQFLGDYIKQRDAALKSIADGTDRQTAYKEFLDGRKNTKEMRNRFKMWQDYAASGELIQPSDLASIEELFSEIDTLAQNENRTAAEEAKFQQLKDAAKYAQSASWAKKMMGYTAYDNHILKWKQDRIDEFNKHYGLRMYSFSDYSPAFVLENMQMVTDAAVKGLKMLAYTKEIEFAKVFAPSGMNINVSVFAAQDPNNGRIMEDEMMGAKWKEAIELREQYPNVGITLVATNDALVEWGLNNPNVDVVIPYHLVRTGQDVAEYFNYKNYTSVSADGKIKGVKYGKGAQKSVYPSEHQNDLIKYVDRLQELQLTPRFESYLKGYEQYLAGTITEQEFRDMNPTYMKLVNETRQSAEQTGTVQPIFDQQAALDSIDTLIKEGGYNKSVLEHLSNNPDMAESILEEITDTVKEKRAEREARRGMQFQTFNSEEEIDAEIDRLQDKIIEIQNAERHAHEAVQNDPRVIEAQEKSWKAQDEKGWTGSLRERVAYKQIYKQVAEELAAQIPEGNLTELADRINELKQQKENFHKNIKITDADYEKLVDNFGTTSDPSVAGFILKDGRMLDFSGKKQYGNQWAGGRDIYHSEVADVISIPSSYSPRVEMVSNGNIRLVPEINGINLSARPTSKQRSALRDFIDYYNGNVHVDIDNLSGRTLESFGYHSGTSASKILADIDNYFKTGQTPAPQSSLAQFRDQYQTAEEWEEGPIYNHRALVSEQTLDRWLDAYAATNPNYAQAFITYMKPDDFLNLTTISRYSRMNIEKEAEGFTPEQVVKASKGQPIFLDIDTETGEILGHEGRHRMVALRRAGIDRVPVLLFDYTNKYSKTPMEELVLTGQDFGQTLNGKPNLANATVRDLLPLSNGNKAAIAEKYGTKTSTERLTEKYSGRQTLQFQMADTQHNEWAPVFYSKMQRTIEDWTNGKGQALPAKMSAQQVVGWLKGKGVKSEEIKWSGVEQYLDGKKTVTKEELLQVMAENEFRIETKVLNSNDAGSTALTVYPDFEDEFTVNNIEEFLEAAKEIAEFNNEDPDAIELHYEDGFYYAMLNGTGLLKASATGKGDTHWIQYSLPGGHNYREILFKIPGSTYTNRSMQTHWNADGASDGEGVMAHARVQDMQTLYGNRMLFVEEIQSDWHNAGTSEGFKDKTAASKNDARIAELQEKLYSLNGAYNYAQQNSIILAMQISQRILHNLQSRTDYDAQIVYSDTSDKTIRNWIIGDAETPFWDSPEEVGSSPYKLFLEVGITEEDKKTIASIQKVYREYRSLDKEYQSLKGSSEYTTRRKAPENIPFAGTSDTYHEYVMKHLLRLAAEGDYDVIGWTTADQQSDRWSDEYAEGYRIEYDQNIPKFMRKYVKQWGAEVAPSVLDNENRDEVWSVEITPEMKQSVLYEGQQQYQMYDNTADDSMFEAEERQKAWNDLQAENAVLEDTVTQLRKEIEKLSKQAAQLKRTDKPEVRMNDARKMARQIIKDTRPEPITTRDKLEIRELTNRLSQQIKEIGDYILETGKNPNEIDYSEIRSMAQDIARDIVNNAEVEIDDGAGTKDMRDEMRAALRNRPIFVPEQYRSDVLDWNDFKKRYRNIFTFKDSGTDIDIIYQSLLEEIPGLLDPNINNPGDMLNELADKWDVLQPKYENPFDDFTNEAINHYTNMILQGALDGTLRQIAPTYADRMNNRISEIRAESRERVAAARVEGRQALEDLRAEKNARIEEIRQQGIARKQEALAKERADKWERVAATREYYQEMAQRASTRRKNSETRTKIKSLINDMNSRLLHGTEKKYVPAHLVENTVRILEMIDLDTGRENVKLQERLALLQQQYSALKNDQTFAGYSYDPILEDLITDMARTVGDTPLRNMNNTQLEKVYQTLRELEHTIRTAVKDKIYGEEINFYESARAATKATNAISGSSANALGKASNWYLTNTMRPDVVFERFGGFAKDSEWTKIADMLNRAQRYGMDLQLKFSQPFEELLKDKKNLAKLTSTKAEDMVDIGLKDENGESIKITRDFMLFTYMNLFNEDNIQHVMRGGITVPALKEYLAGRGDRGYGIGSRHAVGISQRLSDINHAIEDSTDANEKAALLQEKEDILKEGMEYINNLRENIEKNLTEYDQKWIDAWWKFNKMATDVLNDTTMNTYGIKKFLVERYFPIITDRNYLNVPMDTIIKDMSLENAGFTKERIHASTPIKMMGLSDVINMQANRTAQYAAMMPAIRAFNKIYNKTMPGYSTSVRDTLNKKFGDSATKFVENLMLDLQGGRRADFTIFDRLRGRMAQATLSLNPRVALAQTASFPTAAAELGWKPVLKALARGGKNNMPISAADRELIAKWSSALWYRSKGGTVELGDVKNMQQASHKVMDKLGWAMNWIEFMDSATVGRLWYAAQYYVDDNYKALQKGSDAYYEKVAEAFNRTIENTQPNYTTLQRPELLRNPDALIRQISMFMTQRLQNQSILYGATAKYLKYRADYQAGKNGVTQDDLREMRLRAVNAATSQVAAAACITIFKFLADMLLHKPNAYRRKEDKTLDAESISLAMLNNFAESLVSNMWLGSELYSAAKSMITKETYYGMELSGVSTLTETVENIVKFGQKPSLSMAKKLGESLSQFLGIPAANAEKIGQAVWYWMQDAMNGEFMEAGVERTDAMNAKLLTEAYASGDKQAIEKYSGTFDDDDDLLDSVRSYIKSGYVSKDKQTISKPEAVKLLVKAGMRQKDAEAKVQEWTCELVTGIPFSKIKDEYMAGNITQARVTELLQKYGGRDKETAERTARSYACEKDTGHPYTDLKEAYILGEVSKNVLEKAVKKYGGMNAEDTQKKLYYYDYLKENPTSDISENRAVAYMTKLKPAGIRAKDYEDILNRADADKNGSYSQAEVGSWLTEKGYNAKQAEALWSAMGPTWKTGFDAWQVKYNADMQATGKGSKNGNVSQRELGPYLVQQINAGKITMEQAEGYWKTFFSKSTTTFKKWLKKNHYKLS